MADVFRLNSSLRSRSLAESLRIVPELAREVGIVRVTDTTRLDRFGVPVFASIRPTAMRKSLCVSAGKGLLPDEAKIGAYMEALELAWTEKATAAYAERHVSPTELAAPLAAFCPRRNAVIDDTPVDCAEARDLISGATVLLPAELVLFPRTARWFSSDTNGLASGNTEREAIVHGLTEVLERDVGSFHRVWDRSRIVRNASIEGPLAPIIAHAENSGCTLSIRYHANDHGLPYFHAVLREIGAHNAVHSGYGLHPWRSIALTRAVVEAFQSRLSFIHGGRDDLGMISMRLGNQRSDALHKFADRYAQDETPIDLAVVPDRAEETATIEDCERVLLDAVSRIGAAYATRFTPAEYPIAVVRVVIAGAEFYNMDTDRMGTRLKKHLYASHAGRAR